MKKIKLNNKGQMIKKDVAFFGGKFSLLERIRKGGIGSPKVIYKEGLAYFDELNTAVENELSFANFELMKDGFLIRLNRNQKLRYVGFQLHEILSVQLKAIPIIDDLTETGIKNKLLPYKGALILSTLHDNHLYFDVSTQYFQGLSTFFSKKVFENKFELLMHT